MDFWTREEGGGAEECELVGKAMAPLVGNGILVGFAGQALLSLCLALWMFFLTKHGNLDIVHPEGSIERAIERRRLDFVSNILMVGSDFQSTLGISYLINAFSGVQIMDTYHLHLVFDICSFVGVSNAAALVCWRFCRAKLDGPDKRREERYPWFNGRYRAVFLFVVLYLALVILLCVRLNDWAPNTSPGRCYHFQLVTNLTAPHPRSDQVYIGITASWLIIVVLSSVFIGVRRRRAILVFAMLHFPLHLYMFIALRQANQGKLEGEVNHENEWDFGQTTAVILLVLALVELITKGKEYYDFEKRVSKHGLSPVASKRTAKEVEEAKTDGYLLETSSGERHPSTNGHSAGGHPES